MRRAIVSHLYTITSHAHRRENVGTPAAGNDLAHTNDTSGGESQFRAPQQGAFAALGMTDGPEQVDEEEDFGGLMVCFIFIRSYWGSSGPHFHL